MKIFFAIIIFIVLSSITAFPQMGGAGTYQFLYLTNSPRVAALGGNNLTLNESDPALAYQNPALLNDSMNKHLALNYVNYFTDINYGYVGYAMNFPKYGNVSVGIHHINYGKFDGTTKLAHLLVNFMLPNMLLTLFTAKILILHLDMELI